MLTVRILEVIFRTQIPLNKLTLYAADESLELIRCPRGIFELVFMLMTGDDGVGIYELLL